jgi:hypothetical protein
MGGKVTGRFSICGACGQDVPSDARGQLGKHYAEGEMCTTKKAACRVCQESHRVRIGGQIANHSGRSGRRCSGSGRTPLTPPEQQPPEDSIACPVCRRMVPSTQSGTVSSHNVGNGGVDWCRGTGMKVTSPPTNGEQRPDDREKSSSIRAISSGLGGLGKRRKT